jgi:hypothetical protein
MILQHGAIFAKIPILQCDLGGSQPPLKTQGIGNEVLKSEYRIGESALMLNVGLQRTRPQRVGWHLSLLPDPALNIGADFDS